MKAKEYLKLTFVVLIITLMVGCKGNGEVKEYYKSGALKSVGNLKNGSLNGLVRFYYETGELMGESYTVEGKRVGINLVYYKNGKVKEKESYNKFGQLHGKYESFYQSGIRSYFCTFSNGKEQGAAAEYYEDGTISQELIFDSGKLNGRQLGYHTNGAKALVANSKSGKDHGIWLFFDLDGDTLKREVYIDGILKSKTQYKESVLVEDIN